MGRLARGGLAGPRHGSSRSCSGSTHKTACCFCCLCCLTTSCLWQAESRGRSRRGRSATRVRICSFRAHGIILVDAGRIQTAIPRTFMPVTPPVTPRSQPTGRELDSGLVMESTAIGRSNQRFAPAQAKVTQSRSFSRAFIKMQALTVGPAAQHACQDASDKQPRPASLVLAAAAAGGGGGHKHSHGSMAQQQST